VLTIHYGNILVIYLVYFVIYLKYTKNDLPELEFHVYAWGWENNFHIILDVVDMVEAHILGVCRHVLKTLGFMLLPTTNDNISSYYVPI
jgi:hypothetical protein